MTPERKRIRMLSQLYRVIVKATHTDAGKTIVYLVDGKNISLTVQMLAETLMHNNLLMEVVASKRKVKLMNGVIIRVETAGDGLRGLQATQVFVDEYSGDMTSSLLGLIHSIERN